MGKGGDRGEESRREGQEKRRVEAGWEHVVCQVSRDHGTKEREEERRTCRGTTIKAEASERERGGGRRREESKGEKMKMSKARMKMGLESEGQ